MEQKDKNKLKEEFVKDKSNGPIKSFKRGKISNCSKLEKFKEKKNWNRRIRTFDHASKEHRLTAWLYSRT